MNVSAKTGYKHCSVNITKLFRFNIIQQGERRNICLVTVLTEHEAHISCPLVKYGIEMKAFHFRQY
jgi:hypothetical protein